MRCRRAGPGRGRGAVRRGRTRTAQQQSDPRPDGAELAPGQPPASSTCSVPTTPTAGWPGRRARPLASSRRTPCPPVPASAAPPARAPVASAEHQVVPRAPERLLDVLAVLRAPGLDLEDHLHLVHPQARRQPLVADLEHVGAEPGEQREQRRRASPGSRGRGSGSRGTARRRTARAAAAWTAAADRCCRRRAPPRPAARSRRAPRASAATPAAPAGSTTCLARSRQSSRARASAASDTVTIRSSDAARMLNGMSPGRCTAMPSAIVGPPTTCTGSPAATEATSPGTASACTPTTRTSGSSECTATVIPAASPPPPTGTTTVRTPGHCSMISKPSVPWPATMS